MSLKGSQKFAVLLCKFSDDDAEPHSLAHYNDLFVNRGTGGLNDYWIENSGGAIDLDGSQVFSWKELEQTAADYIASHPSRWDKIQGAVDLFGITLSDWSGVVALFNRAPGDGGASGQGVLGGADSLTLTFMAHETGHVLGLAHSFDQSNRKNADWSAPGEYFDGYDIMSAMNVAAHSNTPFALSGPLLCAANRDLLGWLPADRVWSPPEGRSSISEIDLVSLGHPEMPGFLAVKTGGFTFEYRTVDGWDQGLGGPCVLIHSLRGTNAVVIASDLPNFVNIWEPGQTFGPGPVEIAAMGGTTVTIEHFNAATKKARLRIMHQLAKPALEGISADRLAGVFEDGGGLIIVGGKVIKVPPRSPILGLLAHLALVSQTDETLSGDIKHEVTGPILHEIERMAKRIRVGGL